MQLQLKKFIRSYALGKARDRTDGNVALGAALAGDASAGVKQHALHNRIGNFREAWKWGVGARSVKDSQMGPCTTMRGKTITICTSCNGSKTLKATTNKGLHIVQCGTCQGKGIIQ